MKKKSITSLKKKAWGLLSKITRLKYSINGYCSCYTCGIKKHWKEMQAGHGFAGRGGAILFEKDIIRPQCFGCNICNSGKLDTFTYKLRKELGDKRFEELYALKHTTKRWYADELEALIAEYEWELI